MIISEDTLAAAARLARCEANYSRAIPQRRDRVIATTNTLQPAEKKIDARALYPVERATARRIRTQPGAST